MKTPTFPHSQHATHCHDVLGLMLSGVMADQFIYHTETSNPLVDFRTRVSNLRLNNGWPILDEFHTTHDFNGEPRRVKRYWLDASAMEAHFKRDPDFKQRCMLFVDAFKAGGAA